MFMYYDNPQCDQSQAPNIHCVRDALNQTGLSNTEFENLIQCFFKGRDINL